jgi:hypothetical protein
MKRLIFSRIFGYGFLVSLLVVAQGAAQSTESRNVKTSITRVVQFSDHTVTIPYAGASLVRNNEGVFGTISTSGLGPDHVVTLWWAIFNDPRACAGAVCAPPDLNNPLVNGSLQFGGGQIVGPNGRADFGGYLRVGDNTGFYRLPMFPNMPDPAPGVVDAKGAEIHFVIRDHGPASSDPQILQQQLNRFPGGCTVSNPCANVQAAIFQR